MARRTMVVAALSVACLLSVPAWSQVIFRADFEDGGKNAVPNAAVNEVKGWVADNKGQVWAVENHPGNKTKALKQLAEGCDKSGNTPLPGGLTLSDGIIQLEMSAGDDDSWGIVFRQTAANKGYLVTFGFNETPAVIVALLDKGCGATGQCNDQAACENNPGNTLNQTPHGLGAIAQDNTQVLLGRIEAVGDHIRIWYVDRKNVKDPLGDLGKPLVDIHDKTHVTGKIGIWHESMANGFIDNVVVTGSSGLAVSPKGKVAAVWADLKGE
ncbi:hypothetical protein FJZ36_15135 [Candidatus Poribacteria bacterium]|nr:hypothetical protein [Candidatus Poribacteria bacterium]